MTWTYTNVKFHVFVMFYLLQTLAMVLCCCCCLESETSVVCSSSCSVSPPELQSLTCGDQLVSTVLWDCSLSSHDHWWQRYHCLVVLETKIFFFIIYLVSILKTTLPTIIISNTWSFSITLWKYVFTFPDCRGLLCSTVWWQGISSIYSEVVLISWAVSNHQTEQEYNWLHSLRWWTQNTVPGLRKGLDPRLLDPVWPGKRPWLRHSS